MSLTRKSLKAMGLTEEQVDSIVDMHAETVNALREEIDRYKTDAQRLAAVEEEPNNLKAKGDDGWQEKHDAVKKELDDYRAEVAAKETKAAKTTAYRGLLKDIGIDEKRMDTVLKVADLDAIEMDGESIKDAETLSETLKNEWADFITPSAPNNPRIDTGAKLGGGGTLSKADILNVKDRDERRALIAQNLSLFKKGE